MLFIFTGEGRFCIGTVLSTSTVLTSIGRIVAGAVLSNNVTESNWVILAAFPAKSKIELTWAEEKTKNKIITK